MYENVEYSEVYGRLAFIPREEYLDGDWKYVDSEVLPSGREIDIIRSSNNLIWCYTVI